jgi:D-3-phosphoglycerate dehydrogenase / 2-oxoglutarate reductase
MARVLVTEKIAERGLELLAERGHAVDVREGLRPEQLVEAVAGAHALVVRSATQVTAEVLAAGTELVVVGRAGVGLDNVDVDAATERGVMVVNAPTSNILSVAEQAMGLLLAQARNIPQAHAALVAGRWERSRWEGVELYGKVLGVVGLGRAGSFVAQRAAAFGMRILGYDPYVSADRARALGVELRSLEEVFAESDFVTVHVPKTAETTGLVGRELLSKAKPGIRIVNTSRGGIVDEDALNDALRAGTVAGAALDVFATEPPGSSPLFELEHVVVTPHLGASTEEAQDKAGVTIAEQVLLALEGDFVPFAVNLAAREVSDAVRPFMQITEQLGRFFACLHGGLPDRLDVEYRGELAGQATGILTLCALKGLFGTTAEEPVSYVNAPQVAERRGLPVEAISAAASPFYKSLVTLRSGAHAVAGTLAGAGARPEPRIVMVDDHTLEVPPAEHMLVVHNDDRPGMIGVVGMALGIAGVSISSMAVGPSADGHTALMVLSTSEPVPPDLVEHLRQGDGIFGIHAVSLTP